MRSSTVHHGGVGFGRLFFQGIRLADRKDTLDLAAKDFNVPVSKVVQYCTRNQPANFWMRCSTTSTWRAMQLP
jgi:hypothetical protein